MLTSLSKYVSSLAQRIQDIVWSTNILQSTFGVIGVVAQHLIKQPCEVIYRNAPAVIGGWEGRESTDICAQLTGTKAIFWGGDNMAECSAMIDRRFKSWYTTLMLCLYAFTMYQIVRLGMCICARKITGSWDAKNKQPQVQLVYFPLPNQWEDIRRDHRPQPLSC